MGGDCKLTCLSPTSDNEFFENRMGYTFTVGTVQAFTFLEKLLNIVYVSNVIIFNKCKSDNGDHSSSSEHFFHNLTPSCARVYLGLHSIHSD